MSLEDRVQELHDHYRGLAAKHRERHDAQWKQGESKDSYSDYVIAGWFNRFVHDLEQILKDGGT